MSGGFPELKNAIENNDEVSLDTYVKLINRVNETGKGTPSLEQKSKMFSRLLPYALALLTHIRKSFALENGKTKASMPPP